MEFVHALQLCESASTSWSETYNNYWLTDSCEPLSLAGRNLPRTNSLTARHSLVTDQGSWHLGGNKNTTAPESSSPVLISGISSWTGDWSSLSSARILDSFRCLTGWDAAISRTRGVWKTSPLSITDWTLRYCHLQTESSGCAQGISSGRIHCIKGSGENAEFIVRTIAGIEDSGEMQGQQGSLRFASS